MDLCDRLISFEMHVVKWTEFHQMWLTVNAFQNVTIAKFRGLTTLKGIKMSFMKCVDWFIVWFNISIHAMHNFSVAFGA